MALSKKKPDPISDKARALNDQIAALESEIKKLDTQLARTPEPKLRSTTIPPGESISRRAEKPAPAPKSSEPVFEEVNRARLAARDEAEAPEIFNELGLRKYDLPALISRLRNHFRGPTTTNPRLVNYLAAGGVQGLRPLRYEKRVARNRFFVLVIVVTAVLLGLFLMIKH
jgi:hypothetical protein